MLCSFSSTIPEMPSHPAEFGGPWGGTHQPLSKINKCESVYVAPLLADFDGTNGLDIVFANGGSCLTNEVCFNDGSASFVCGFVSLDNNSSNDVALADVDGDGDTDALFANNKTPNRACLNDGAGSFTCSDISADANRSKGVATIPPWNFSDGFESGDTSAWSDTVP